MEKLRTTEKVGYAFGDFACCLIWQTISVYLLYYLANVAGIDSADAIRIISLSKLIDGATDVLMGFVIDRTRSRFGHVRPYILTMGLPLAVSTVLLFSMPAGMAMQSRLLWIAVWYNLVTTVFYTALNVPYSSMHIFLSDSTEERGRLSVLRLIFAYAAMVLVNAGVFVLVRGLGDGTLQSQTGWTRTILVIGAAQFLLTLVTFFTTRERVAASPSGGREPSVRVSIGSILRNRYLLLLFAAELIAFATSGLTAGSAVYYAQFVLGNEETVGLMNNASMITQVICLILVVPRLMKRWPKGLLYQSGTALMVLACLLNALFPAAFACVLAANILKGAALAVCGPLIYAMCADAIDYGEWKTGVQAAGLGTAILQCCVKIGLALGTALMGIVFRWGGFEATAAEQTADGIRSLVVSYALLPALFFALSVVVMLFYRLDKIYPDFIGELKARRAEK